MDYKTYEMEPFTNISRVQYISSPNNFENQISFPFQSEFTKQQLNNYSPIDLSTSFSSSDKYLLNSKNSFDDILRNKNCNCECHKKIICQCVCNNLLNQVSQLKNTNQQLTNDFIKNKNENYYADNYIKQLEKEKGMFKNNLNNEVDVDKLKLDNGKLIDMLDKTFTNILFPLSKNINNPEGKLKGGVDYYSQRKLEFDNMINEQKDFLDNILKNNTFVNNMKKSNLDNSLNKNPNNLYPNNNIMRPYQTYEIDKNTLPNKYSLKDNCQFDNNINPINENKNNIYSPKTNIENPNNNLNNSSNIPYEQMSSSIRNNIPNEFNNTIRSNYQDPLSNSYQSGKDYKPDNYNLSGSLNNENQGINPNYDRKKNTLNSNPDESNQLNKKINPNDKLRSKGKKKLSPNKKPQNKKEKQLKGNQDKFIPNYPISRDNHIPKDNKVNLNQSNELKKRPKSVIKKPYQNSNNLPISDNKSPIKDKNPNDDILPNSFQNLIKDNQIPNNQQLNSKIDPETEKPYLNDKPPYKLNNLNSRDKENPMLSSLSPPFNQTFNSNNKDNQNPSKNYMKYPNNYLDNINVPNQFNNMNEPYKNIIPNQFNNEPYTNQIPNQITNINDPLNPNKTILNNLNQYPQNENNNPLSNTLNSNNNYTNEPNIPYTNAPQSNNIELNEQKKNPKFLSSSIPYIQNYLKDNIINNNNLNTPYNQIQERKNHSSSPNQNEKFRKLSPSNPYNKLKSNRTGSGSREKKYNKIIYYPDGTCWACDVGCSISTTGYSPMTFSPYVNNVKRRDVTPVKPGTRYEEYTRHKKKKH